MICLQLGPRAVDKEGRMILIGASSLSLKDMVSTLERVEQRVCEEGIAAKYR